MPNNVVHPLVSVLVPAHNHERYITGALESVAAETYRPIELLVCDDGSTDRTAAVADEWIACHPEIPAYLIRQENQGITKTLNVLLSAARGWYVTMLASDDELIPGGIAARIDAIGTGVRAVFGDAEVIDQTGVTRSPSLLDARGANRHRLVSDLASEIILKWAVPGPVLLAERAAIREIGGYCEDLMLEDWDLYLRLVARGWLRFTPAVVARYRIHGGWSSRIENFARMDADLRLAAERNRQLFRGRHRAAIEFQRMFYVPPLSVLVRLISKALRLADSRWSVRYRRDPDLRRRSLRRPEAESPEP